MRNTFWLSVCFALVVFFAIRLPLFSKIPAGLNRDEAALGYNAYSILKTGRDEYGKLFPISITSFGDQKLPGYVYTFIPFIATFGLHAWVVRLPSLLAGVAIVVLVGLLAQQLSEVFISNKKLKMFFPLLAMVAVALSPWSNHFSRVAYEAHLALAFFMAGLTILFFSRTQKGFLRSSIWTALFWSLSMLTYHSYQIFIPLIALGVIIIDRSIVKKTNRLTVLMCVGITAITLAIMFFGGVWSGNTKKSQGISPFHADSVWRTITIYRNAFPGPLLLKKIVFNRAYEVISRYAGNYVTTLSGSFFFVVGSSHPDHNPGNVPNLQLYAFPFILFGLFTLWEKRQHKEAQYLFLWIVAALAAPAFTISPEHTVRISQIFPVLDLLTAFGVLVVLQFTTSITTRKILAIVLAVIVFFSTLRYLTQYVVIAQTANVSHEKYTLLARAIQKYRTADNEIVTQSPSSSPYIWYLFETAMDPRVFWQTVERYPETDEFFIHVHKVGNITFESIQWDNIFERGTKHPVILLFTPSETTPDMRISGNIKLLEELNDRFGNTQYEVWSVQ